MKSDEELLAEWQRDRGRNAAKLTPHQMPQMVKALRDRETAIHNPKPLEFCSVCQAKARGPHRKK